MKPCSGCWEQRNGLFVQCKTQQSPVIVMLALLIYFASRKRAFHWSPAVDLSDPYIAAALVPVSYS
jgi:hypothetical protein